MMTSRCTAAALAILLPPMAAFAQSSVYSPTLQSLAIPAAVGELRLGAALSALPETRPKAIDRNLSYGVDLSVGYGFTPRTYLGLRAYMDLTGTTYTGDRRGGLGAELTTTLSDSNAATHLAFAARVQTVYSGTSSDGVGGALSLIIRPPASGAMATYIGLGPYIGLGSLDGPPPRYDFNSTLATEQSTRTQWGYGVMANVGESIRLSDVVEMFVEVAGGIQLNEWESITTLFAAPSIGLVWRP